MVCSGAMVGCRAVVRGGVIRFILLASDDGDEGEGWGRGGRWSVVGNSSNVLQQPEATPRPASRLILCVCVWDAGGAVRCVVMCVQTLGSAHSSSAPLWSRFLRPSRPFFASRFFSIRLTASSTPHLAHVGYLTLTTPVSNWSGIQRTK